MAQTREEEILEKIGKSLSEFHITNYDEAYIELLDSPVVVLECITKIEEILSTQCNKAEDIDSQTLICKALGFQLNELQLTFDDSFEKIEEVISKLKGKNSILLFALGKLSLTSAPKYFTALIAFKACYETNTNFISEFGMMHVIRIYLSGLTKLAYHNLQAKLTAMLEHYATKIVDIFYQNILETLEMPIETAFSTFFVSKNMIMNFYSDFDRIAPQITENTMAEYLSLFILTSHLPQKNLLSLISTIPPSDAASILRTDFNYYRSSQKACAFYEASLQYNDKPKQLGNEQIDFNRIKALPQYVQKSLASLDIDVLEGTRAAIIDALDEGLSIKQLAEDSLGFMDFIRLIRVDSPDIDPFLMICLDYQLKLTKQVEQDLKKISPPEITDASLQNIIPLFEKIPFFPLLDVFRTRKISDFLLKLKDIIATLQNKNFSSAMLEIIQNFITSRIDPMSTWEVMQKWLNGYCNPATLQLVPSSFECDNTNTRPHEVNLVIWALFISEPDFSKKHKAAISHLVNFLLKKATSKDDNTVTSDIIIVLKDCNETIQRLKINKINRQLIANIRELKPIIESLSIILLRNCHSLERLETMLLWSLKDLSYIDYLLKTFPDSAVSLLEIASDNRWSDNEWFNICSLIYHNLDKPLKGYDDLYSQWQRLNALNSSLSSATILSKLVVNQTTNEGQRDVEMLDSENIPDKKRKIEDNTAPNKNILENSESTSNKSVKSDTADKKNDIANIDLDNLNQSNLPKTK
jgi:hypothetical protein